MMRSLFAGVSGLRNHQTRMDVIGNNIANVNTVGFKASRAQFQDVLSQTLQGAASAQGNRGGTNPMQVGLGMGLASIDTIFTDGSFQPTGKQTDLSIQGQGFFVLSDGLNQVYTRAGNFDFDNVGNYLVPGTGYKVMGWMADASGNIGTTGSITTIQIPVGATMNAKASTDIAFENNLSASDDIGKTAQTSIEVYDSLGVSHLIGENYVKIDANTWLAKSTVADAKAGTLTGDLRLITFNKDGTLNNIQNVAATAASKTLQFGAGNFKLDNTLNSVSSHNFTVFDDSGTPHNFKISFTCTSTSPDEWSYSITDPSSTSTAAIGSGSIQYTGSAYEFSAGVSTAGFTYPAGTGGTTYTIDLTGVTGESTPPVFTPTKTYNTTTSSNLKFTPSSGAANDMDISLSMGTLTQYGGTSTVQATTQNGYAAGTLSNTTIDPSGIIVGKFSNGQTKNLAQVCLATFNNPAGLNKAGENLYTASNNSGVAQIGAANTGGRGKFSPGTLEMSNVDLAQEFSNMIITQRGFQANSKIISTDDEMLQELANLKR